MPIQTSNTAWTNLLSWISKGYRRRHSWSMVKVPYGLNKHWSVIGPGIFDFTASSSLFISVRSSGIHKTFCDSSCGNYLRRQGLTINNWHPFAYIAKRLRHRLRSQHYGISPVNFLNDNLFSSAILLVGKIPRRLKLNNLCTISYSMLFKYVFSQFHILDDK